MASPNPSAAGAPLALSIIAGTIIGALLHQPSLGLVIGTAVGTLIAIAVWLGDRRRLGE